jgi:hypothetical protein
MAISVISLRTGPAPRPAISPKVIGCRHLPIACVPLLADRIKTTGEFGCVFRIAEFLERVGERCDAHLLILLAGGCRIAFDCIDHLASDLMALEIEPADVAERAGMPLYICTPSVSRCDIQ